MIGYVDHATSSPNSGSINSATAVLKVLERYMRASTQVLAIYGDTMKMIGAKKGISRRYREMGKRH